jgi:hypothetical protein
MLVFFKEEPPYGIPRIKVASRDMAMLMLLTPARQINHTKLLKIHITCRHIKFHNGSLFIT